MIETIFVIGIFFLELVGVIDQLFTNNYQRVYWTERAAYYKRRAQHPPKQKGVAVVAPQTTPEVKI